MAIFSLVCTVSYETKMQHPYRNRREILYNSFISNKQQFPLRNKPARSNGSVNRYKKVFFSSCIIILVYMKWVLYKCMLTKQKAKIYIIMIKRGVINSYIFRICKKKKEKSSPSLGSNPHPSTPICSSTTYCIQS